MTGPAAPGRSRAPRLPQHTVTGAVGVFSLLRQLLRDRRGRPPSRQRPVRRSHARAGVLGLRRVPEHLRPRLAGRCHPIHRGRRRTRAARAHRRGGELRAGGALGRPPWSPSRSCSPSRLSASHLFERPRCRAAERPAPAVRALCGRGASSGCRRLRSSVCSRVSSATDGSRSSICRARSSTPCSR